jgi:hypothetical protein
MLQFITRFYKQKMQFTGINEKIKLELKICPKVLVSLPTLLLKIVQVNLLCKKCSKNAKI